mmetsp:Transcript_86106/g.263532  ORF Transcript_86106/g.263532 Transcript_86106/m.263532 type:complete len:203 (-) Transcript_86106:8-616(-)
MHDTSGWRCLYWQLGKWSRSWLGLPRLRQRLRSIPWRASVRFQGGFRCRDMVRRLCVHGPIPGWREARRGRGEVARRVELRGQLACWPARWPRRAAHARWACVPRPVGAVIAEWLGRIPVARRKHVRGRVPFRQEKRFRHPHRARQTAQPWHLATRLADRRRGPGGGDGHGVRQSATTACARPPEAPGAPCAEQALCHGPLA